MWAIRAGSAAKAEQLISASHWSQIKSMKNIRLKKMQAMLSKPAAGGRQLIGLCFCLSENTELTSAWEALARDSPYRIGGVKQRFRICWPHWPDLCSSTTTCPTNSSWWEEVLHQWNEQQQESPRIWPFYSNHSHCLGLLSTVCLLEKHLSSSCCEGKE